MTMKAVYSVTPVSIDSQGDCGFCEGLKTVVGRDGTVGKCPRCGGVGGVQCERRVWTAVGPIYLNEADYKVFKEGCYGVVHEQADSVTNMYSTREAAEKMAVRMNKR